MTRIAKTFSVAIFSPSEPSKVLVIQRSPYDRYFPLLWGLPAGSLRRKESYEQAILKTCQRKLGVGVEVGALLEEGQRDRGTHGIHMRLYQATITDGELALPKPPGRYDYVAWDWRHPDSLQETIDRGSLCCFLLSNALNP